MKYQLCWGHRGHKRADVYRLQTTTAHCAHINDIDTYQRESFVAIIDTLMFNELHMLTYLIIAINKHLLF